MYFDVVKRVCRKYRPPIVEPGINIWDHLDKRWPWHRFRKYTAFIIGKREVMAGWDRQKLSDILDAHIQRDLLRLTPV